MGYLTYLHEYSFIMSDIVQNLSTKSHCIRTLDIHLYEQTHQTFILYSNPSLFTCIWSARLAFHGIAHTSDLAVTLKLLQHRPSKLVSVPEHALALHLSICNKLNATGSEAFPPTYGQNHHLQHDTSKQRSNSPETRIRMDLPYKR